MSSEMRALVKEMRAGTPCYVAKVGGGRCVNGAECLRCAERLDWADRLERALLARTEAGADGAIYQMMATDEDVDEDGNVRPDDPRLWMDHSREEYERLNNHPSVRSRIVYTNPQDASGDAVTGRVNGYMFSARAIEIITDGEVPEWITKTPGLRVTITAMQAKEAK